MQTGFWLWAHGPSLQGLRNERVSLLVCSVEHSLLPETLTDLVRTKLPSVRSLVKFERTWIFSTDHLLRVPNICEVNLRSRKEHASYFFKESFEWRWLLHSRLQMTTLLFYGNASERNAFSKITWRNAWCQWLKWLESNTTCMIWKPQANKTTCRCSNRSPRTALRLLPLSFSRWRRRGQGIPWRLWLCSDDLSPSSFLVWHSLPVLSVACP